MQPTQTPTQMPQQDPLPDLNTLTSNAFFPFPSAAGAASAEGGQQQMATANLYEASQAESIMKAAAGDGKSAATAPEPAASNLLGRLTVSTLAAQSAAPGTSPQSQPCLVPQFTPLGAGACSNASRSSAPSYSSASVPIGCGPQMYSGDTSFLYPNFVNEMSSLTPPQSAQGHTEGFVAGVTTPPAMPMNSSTMSNKGGSMNDNTSTSLSQATSSGIATSSGQPNDAEVRSNLFVCGLPVSVRDKELLELFEKHGEIESAKVMLDIHTGRSRGIAFVKFKNVEHAENAVDALNGTTVNGHQITVRVANSRAAYLPGNPTNKTFVRNVPLTVSRTTLFEYFAQFGEVTDLSIKSDTAQGRHNPSGRSASTTEDGVDDKLNIVFITYSTKEAAAKAAEATHTKTPFKECNGVPLLAKVAEDTVRRMERLSRRQRPATGAEGTREVSTSSSSTNVASMSRFAAPSMGAALPTGMMMPPMMPMTGGFPPGTFVSVPTMGNTPDLTAPTMMPANVAGDHVTALRDASGNPIYAPAQPNPATATGGMAYAMPGNMAQPSIFFSAQPPPPTINQSPPQQLQQQPQQQPQPQAKTQTLYISTPSGFVPAPQQQQPSQQQQPLQFFPAPPLMPQAPQQSQQAMPMSGAAPGQLVYMQTPSGSMMPVMYGGAQPATASMLPTQQMNPYFVMMGGQPPSNQ
ncbi:RNA binding protein, putative [Leishmania donovani]|uniref:RNA binding protein, putative n=1 Tax=Leishmania donovani TaxID=5661 RepID=A0A3S7WYI1_LEIDO|nr:RNA binding protein, putative [Leishmania donovani]